MSLLSWPTTLSLGIFNIHTIASINIFTIMNIIGLIMGCKWGVDPPVKAPPDALTSRAAHPFPPSSELIQLQMEFTLLFLRVRVRGKVKKKNNKLKKNCLRCKCIPLTLSLKTTTPRKRKQITTHLLHKIQKNIERQFS